MKWQWSEDELHTHWVLSSNELALLTKKTQHGRLGFVILLKFFQHQGRFPEQRDSIPDVVVNYLAHQIGTAPHHLNNYDWSGRTGIRDRTEILTFLGVRRVRSEDKKALALWLHADVLPDDPTFDYLNWLRVI